MLRSQESTKSEQENTSLKIGGNDVPGEF